MRSKSLSVTDTVSFKMNEFRNCSLPSINLCNEKISKPSSSLAVSLSQYHNTTKIPNDTKPHLPTTNVSTALLFLRPTFSRQDSVWNRNYPEFYLARCGGSLVFLHRDHWCFLYLVLAHHLSCGHKKRIYKFIKTWRQPGMITKNLSSIFACAQTLKFKLSVVGDIKKTLKFKALICDSNNTNWIIAHFNTWSH